MKQIIRTHCAPQAIGAYSQAVKAGDTVYISGQIPLLPETMELVSDNMEAQISQVFKNLAHVTQAAGGELKDIVKLTIYLVDINHFALINEVIARYFEEPYPARVVIGVNALPKAAKVEVDAIMVISD
jgi:reactive intermediate/imine deaminase